METPYSLLSKVDECPDFDPRTGEPTKPKETSNTQKTPDTCFVCQKVKLVRSVISPSYYMRCIDCDHKRNCVLELSKYNNDNKCGSKDCDQYGAVKWCKCHNICYDCVQATVTIEYHKGWNTRVSRVSSLDVRKTIQEALDSTSTFYVPDTQRIVAVRINFDKESLFVTDFSKTFLGLNIRENIKLIFTAWRCEDKQMGSD